MYGDRRDPGLVNRQLVPGSVSGCVLRSKAEVDRAGCLMACPPVHMCGYMCVHSQLMCGYMGVYS